MSKLWQAIRFGLNSVPVMQDASVHPTNFVSNNDRDAYSSLYYYNEDQRKRVDEKNSAAGIRDTVTNRLFFDFDGPSASVEEGGVPAPNLVSAQKDAFKLAQRLFERGFEVDEILVYFSGYKGFSVEVITDKYLTPEEFKQVTSSLAGDLKTFDKVVSDANRIIRIPDTKHQKSPYYKVYLTLEELEFSTINEIQALAVKPRYTDKNVIYPKPATWPSDLAYEVQPLINKIILSATDKFYIDWSKKPAAWRNCKWALLQGHFDPGQRHEALIRLAATHRGMGYDKITNYYMCKSALKKQAELFGQEEFDKSELWLNIIEQSVYSDVWNGGAYSCKSDVWLKSYCSKLGPHACPSDNHLTVKTSEVFSFFENYAQNYDKNALTTGIGPLDAECRLMVGTSNALLAPPGVGKTSLSLQVLNHNSSKGIRSVFFSYDMFHAALLMRMIQRHTGLAQNTIFEIWKSKDARKKEIQDLLEKEYKYVDFCFKSGQSAEEITDTIDEVEAKTGEKVKLVVVDYNELVISDKSDDTSASAQTAQKLRKIANEKQVCVLTLLQPSKVYSSPADEITNYNAAKGASSIAQSMTLMLGCARPGFNPLDSSNDNYYNVTCLKNRNGGLFSVDLGWEGLRGNFSTLTDDQRQKLKELRLRKSETKVDGAAGWR